MSLKLINLVKSITVFSTKWYIRGSRSYIPTYQSTNQTTGSDSYIWNRFYPESTPVRFFMSYFLNPKEVDLKIKDDEPIYNEALLKAQTPPPQQSAYDSSRKETRSNELYGEEDDINSDLDDSDDDGNTESEETQNIILCLYDKVNDITGLN